MEKNKRIKELVKRLMQYKDSYYNTGNSEISDEQFDFEEQELRDLDPGNKYFNMIGSVVKTDNKDDTVIHTFPMLSMQKVKVVEDAIKWLFDLLKNNSLIFDDPNNIKVFAEPKLDGISGSVMYDKYGNIKYVSTRGDGFVGQMIHSGLLIDSIPKHYLPNYELRGEFCIKKLNRNMFNGPLRNICSGILKRKVGYEEDIKYIDFIIYDSFDENNNFFEFKNRKDKIQKIDSILQEQGETNYNLVEIIEGLDIRKIYDNYINNLRDKWSYETDGLVLTIDGGKHNYESINSNYTITNHNKYNMALKPPAKFSKTQIIGFNIEVSKLGKLAPVALVKPVIIDSIKIEKATLYNFDFVNKNNVGIGSTVLIHRSNDVIPKIEEVYNHPEDNVKPFVLKRCPCCKSELVRISKDLLCPNFNGCKDIYKSKISNMLDICNIKNIGPSIINNIVESFNKRELPYYISTFINFILSDELKDEILHEHYTRGSLKYINIKREIDSILDKMTELNLIVGFCIPLVGSKILMKNKIFGCEDLLKYINELEKSNIETSAFDSTLLKFFSNKINKVDFDNSYKLMKKYFKPITIPKGFKFCISGEILGRTKKDIIMEIEKTGNQFVKDVTMDLDFLISDEKGTLKVLKANKYKIKILSYEDFKKQFC